MDRQKQVKKTCGGYVYKNYRFLKKPTKKQIEEIDNLFVEYEHQKNASKKHETSTMKIMSTEKLQKKLMNGVTNKMNTYNYRIICRRWFQKSYGNTYHSTYVYDANDKLITSKVGVYGYGDHCLQTASDMLREHLKSKSKKNYWQFLKFKKCIYEIHDVTRERDL